MTQPLLFPLRFPVEELRSRLCSIAHPHGREAGRYSYRRPVRAHGLFRGYRSTAAMYQALLIHLDQEAVTVIGELDLPVSAKKAG
ncbi:hypothetical protein [Bradyrhizobium sp. 172]|uniref:hypothetical protein n=1 Tax=Bradyrhizobium sp. 172 TaxID=2782643 RepID=UPI001FFF516D|nr:hypothetical protein [Bradyrhizobium sp. 172]UPJ94883.1 hypothetical protein IVB07_31425 [Bradyrhizobium sp. 172]